MLQRNRVPKGMCNWKILLFKDIAFLYVFPEGGREFAYVEVFVVDDHEEDTEEEGGEDGDVDPVPVSPVPTTLHNTKFKTIMIQAVIQYTVH